MAVAAATVLSMAATILQDSAGKRWPATELVTWLNAGQREIVVYRPDATSKLASVPLVAGTRQVLPADGAKLIDVPRNTNGPAIRLVDRKILDAQLPGWHTSKGGVIVHFMFDDRDPRAFYVYRPAANGAAVDALYSAFPADVAAPAAGVQAAAVVGNIGVPDIYETALLDYVLARAYAKDAQVAGNAARAQAHYMAFGNALGVELKGTLQFGPNASGEAGADETPPAAPMPQ